MANLKLISRQLRLAVAENLGPEALSARLAAFAIEEREKVIKAGEAVDSYETYVDGIKGAPEKSVKPDGEITYKFNYLGPAIAFTLAYVTKRSPVYSGKFRKSWQVAVNGKIWRKSWDKVPFNAEVMIFNPLPYARKIEVGAMKKMTVAPQILQEARLVVRRNFKNLDVFRTFVTLPSPYHLKRTGKSRNTRAGQAINYPALTIKRKV